MLNPDQTKTQADPKQALEEMAPEILQCDGVYTYIDLNLFQSRNIIPLVSQLSVFKYCILMPLSVLRELGQSRIFGQL